MNKKDFLLPFAWLLLATNVGCSALNKTSLEEQQKVPAIIQNTNKEVGEILKTPEIKTPEKEQITQVIEKQEKILKGSNTIRTINIADINKKSPLGMDWIPQDIRRFLGYTDWEEIILKYNNPVIINWKISTKLRDYSQINFPLVLDKYKNLPTRIEDFKVKNPFFADKIWNDKTVIIAGKDSSGKCMIISYLNWSLHTANTASLWEFESSPEWVFRILMKDPYKRSSLHKNAPMAYSIQVIWHYFGHDWQVDWLLLSHWCFRNPWFYAKEIYENFSCWDKFISYYKTQTINI